MNGNVILRMQGIRKSFAGVEALKGVDFEVRCGEIHSLIGENGAGKSTLVEILSGGLTRDKGEIILKGGPAALESPLAARRAGISIVHQKLAYVPYLSVAENICLGQKRVESSFATVSQQKMFAEARRVLILLDADVDPRALMVNLSMSQKQLVEIARGLSLDAEIYILDEPTSCLSDVEARHLFGIIKGLCNNGSSAIFISHRLDEVLKISDRITVLKDGEIVATLPAADASPGGLIQLMIGRRVENIFPTRTNPPGKRVGLTVRGLSRAPHLKTVDVDVREGEILGITGLLGSGMAELARAIFGADSRDTGEILLCGRPVNIRTPADAINLGIALVPGDRAKEGLILDLSVKDNITLANLNKVCNGLAIIQPSVEEKYCAQFVSSLKIRTPRVNQIVRFLSGGNQQKVMLAKWLFREANVFLFVEPTAGIDVGAKLDVYQLIATLADRGACVMFISSEFPEILGLSDRILVMREGQIVDEFNRGQGGEDRIHYAAAVA